MSYTSLPLYLFVIPPCLLIYYIIPKRFRWIVLLLGSIAFYLSCGLEIPRLITFVFSIIAVFFASVLISKSKKRSTARIILVCAIIVSCFPLFAGKLVPYSRITSLTNLSSLIVPVGCSFYSMQAIAYLSDVYTGKISPAKNFFHFFLFISFFPQILQGPIPRYKELFPQLIDGNLFDKEKFVHGFQLILWGFFLKMIIADRLTVIVNSVFDSFPRYQGVYVVIGVFAFSFQLYTDFLACTTLSRGISLLFGISLDNNFMRPYFSTSIKDFWRRWHITLSSWLKDYVYIPLGGNRKGKIRKYANLLITFFVSGLWHGPGLSFIVWGLIHGVYQIFGDICRPLKERIFKLIRLSEDSLSAKIIQIPITFLLTSVAWIFFRADSVKKSLEIIVSAVKIWNPWVLFDGSLSLLGLDFTEWNLIIIGMVILFIVGVLQEKKVKIGYVISRQHILIRWIIYIVVIGFIWIFGVYGYGYEASAFIYRGF